MSKFIMYTKMGWKCNSSCVFCAVGDEIGPQELHYSSIIHQLEIGRKYQAEILTLSGGEPTIRKDLVKIIRAARSMGYSSIHLQTNGKELSRLNYCELLINAGVTRFVVSLHGNTKEIHDKITNCQGSFDQTILGINNIILIGNPKSVSTNTTIITKNVNNLAQTIELLEEIGVKIINLSYVQPSGAARFIMDSIAPKMSDVASNILSILENNNLSAKININGIPPCLFDGYAYLVQNQLYEPAVLLDRINGWSIYKVLSNYQVRGKYQKLEYPAVLKILPPGISINKDDYFDPLLFSLECEGCSLRLICPGIWEYYYQKFGLEEFKPVKNL